MDISIIIPLYNEEDSIPHLVAWIEKVVVEHNFSYEIIMVNDGSNDSSWEAIENLAQKNKNIRGISFQRNYGKSAALHCGFQAAQGNVVITMDADLQDSPDEIPELFKMITEEKYDLVSGWKKKRYDSKLTKNIPSKIYNATARKISGVKLHDMNCGLKAYRKDVVKSIEVYGEMHRYIPIIAKWAGFYNIGEKVVEHRARQYGETKFGLNRFIHGYLDLLTIMFISKFRKSPMYFFGSVGSLMFFLGLMAAVWLGAYKIYCVSRGIPAILVTNNPYFYIALTAMILGTQLFLAGFLAELISRNSSERNNYLINKRI
ncbi:MAG: glycosyltransferase family 2 protein [Prevotellaceae bacterium]|jgi:glycosyltransferase involved in cell wall biosynthesis|nr:glycosyltransferase family 2 protein [Prevotellaceae bacterium]